MTTNNEKKPPAVNIEYCSLCDYKGHCMELAKLIKTTTPEASIVCERGRQGSFEITVNENLIYSKLKTMALPDYDEVNQVISDAASGGEIRQITKQQPIECSIS